jgi:OOP family OmpA-OmpF porin
VAQQLSELLRGEATFGPNNVALSDAGSALLDEAIEILAANPASNLIVEGHTDSQGDAAANLELSQRRAEAVVAYLVEGGIEADRLTAIGYGEERPIADNVSEVGRAQNRRIEFVVREGDG